MHGRPSPSPGGSPEATIGDTLTPLGAPRGLLFKGRQAAEPSSGSPIPGGDVVLGALTRLVNGAQQPLQVALVVDEVDVRGVHHQQRRLRVAGEELVVRVDELFQIPSVKLALELAAA